MASGDGVNTIELEATSFYGNKIQDNSLKLDENEKEEISAGYGRSNQYRGGKTEKERKIGHRRVGEGGEITYKKIQTSQIMGSIQLGIQHTVGSLASKPKRDLLMMDFWEIESISFPPEGSSLTPAHHYCEFRFKIYAPIAFRYFRDLFGIQPDDFMMSMCSSPLRELSNPGASGSIFYLTNDDEFIIKTVQHKEGEFLQKLLPGYYMNLNQNPRTLLPKFFGLYCFQCNSKNVRLIVMNNLLPSFVQMHLKYDLKGSTYKRKASKGERSKNSPTYKDLDFMEHHPNGIFLEADTYNALIKTIQRDCTVLESFKIMDYSLLVGVHNLDLAFKKKHEQKKTEPSRSPRVDDSDLEDAPEADQYNALEWRERTGATSLNRNSPCYRSINRQRLVAHSTAMESIQAESEPIDEEEDIPSGGIPARSEKGERLLLFIGIIDILQSYRLKKKLEHTFKSIIHDGDTVSVCRPSFYAQRFQNFMAKTVFKKIPSLDLPEIKGNHRKFRTLVSSYIALKHSPSKRKSLSKVIQKSTEADADTHAPIYFDSQNYSKSISSNVNDNISHVTQKIHARKQKKPPPVPPRGSPKYPKGLQQKSKDLETIMQISPTGRLNTLAHKENDFYLEMPVKIPYFGEKRSPANVTDWLELHNFVENKKEIESLVCADISEQLSKKIRRPSSNLQRRCSIMSLGGRSSIGTPCFMRNVPTINQEESVNENLCSKKKRKEIKDNIFYYVDMVLSEDDQTQDNLINYLGVLVEMKSEIQSYTKK